MTVNRQSQCPIPEADTEIGIATNASGGRRVAFAGLFSQVIAVLLALVVATKLSAAIVDAWYFGMVWYPVWEFIQAAVLCVVIWMA